MRGFPSDLEIATADHPQLRRDENSPEVERDARDVIRLHATDIDDAELLLQMTGLAPSPSRTGTRARDRTGLGPRYGTPRPEPAPRASKRALDWATAAERAAADPSLVPHGSITGYAYWRCRCERCRAAKADEKAKQRAKRKTTKENGS